MLFYLAGIPRLPRRSAALLLRRSPLLGSGLPRPYGSGVRRGLRDSGVEPRRGEREPRSTLPRLLPPLILPRRSVGASRIS